MTLKLYFPKALVVNCFFFLISIQRVVQSCLLYNVFFYNNSPQTFRTDNLRSVFWERKKFQDQIFGKSSLELQLGCCKANPGDGEKWVTMRKEEKRTPGTYILATNICNTFLLMKKFVLLWVRFRAQSEMTVTSLNDLMNNYFPQVRIYSLHVVMICKIEVYI